MRQEQALQLLKMGKNVFLTGAAGAGKTYLLNQYIQYLKNHQVGVSITASTGIAATHLQGNTIHSWSGIGVRDVLTDKDLDKIKSRPHIKRNYKKTKVLIIDEISMLHAHQLDMIDQAAKFILENDKPFGGIQIVLCGDFFQLPPVGQALQSIFCYQATSWNNADIHICYLEEQHRQSDDLLLTILNDIRSGTAGEHTKVPLRTRYKKDPIGTAKATKLYAKNMNVDAINEGMLEELSGKEKIFTMKGKGFGALVDSLKKSCLAPEKLRLKIGAEVMFVKNDPIGFYVNGTRGIVIGFEKNSDQFPIVKTHDHRYITAAPCEWKYEEHGSVRAIIEQVPLRLAWAITIHKSQGMTLDAVEIDLGDTFEPGMGYVALSRARSLDGLKLMNLNEMALKVHPQVLKDDENFKQQSLQNRHFLTNLTETEINALQLQTLLVTFGGTLDPQSVVRPKGEKKKKTPNHLLTHQLLQEKLAVDSIAEKLGFTFGTIIKHIEKLLLTNTITLTDIEHLKASFLPEEFSTLLSEFNQSPNGWLTPVFEKFNKKFSYEQLHIVRLFATCG